MNKTQQTIYSYLHESPRTWAKVSADLSKVAIKSCKLKKGQKEPSTYGIFYNNIFTGFFIVASLIDKQELKEAKIKILPGEMMT